MIFKYYGGPDNNHELSNPADYEGVPAYDPDEPRLINDDVFP